MASMSLVMDVSFHASASWRWDAREGRHDMPPKSKAQARLFGAAAGGKKTKAKSLSRSQAREALRGVKVKKLPARKRKRRKK